MIVQHAKYHKIDSIVLEFMAASDNKYCKIYSYRKLLVNLLLQKKVSNRFFTHGLSAISRFPALIHFAGEMSSMGEYIVLVHKYDMIKT